MMLPAAATGRPVLAINRSAAWIGAADVAPGNLFAACLLNLLILAVLDMAYRTGGRMLSRGAAAHALPADSCVLLVGIPVLFLLLGGRADWGPLRFGPGSPALALAHPLCARMIVFDQSATALRGDAQDATLVLLMMLGAFAPPG